MPRGGRMPAARRAATATPLRRTCRSDRARWRLASRAAAARRPMAPQPRRAAAGARGRCTASPARRPRTWPTCCRRSRLRWQHRGAAARQPGWAARPGRPPPGAGQPRQPDWQPPGSGCSAWPPGSPRWRSACCSPSRARRSSLAVITLLRAADRAQHALPSGAAGAAPGQATSLVVIVTAPVDGRPPALSRRCCWRRSPLGRRAPAAAASVLLVQGGRCQGGQLGGGRRGGLLLLRARFAPPRRQLRRMSRRGDPQPGRDDGGVHLFAGRWPPRWCPLRCLSRRWSGRPRPQRSRTCCPAAVTGRVAALRPAVAAGATPWACCTCPEPCSASGRTRPRAMTSLASRVRRFGALGHAELQVEPQQVLLDRRLGHDQVVGDLPGGGGRDERVVGQRRAAQRDQHVELPPRQLGGGGAAQFGLRGQFLLRQALDPAARGAESQHVTVVQHPAGDGPAVYPRAVT